MLATIDADPLADTLAEISPCDFCVTNVHMLDRLAKLAAELELSLGADVVNESGVSLWPKTEPVSPALFKTLRGQRLQAPLEAILNVRQGLLPERIVSDCLALMQESPALQAIGRARGALDALLRLGNQSLPPALCLLLTTIRQQQPKRYERHLAAMLISAGLAHALRLDETEASALIMASFTCDIGELYLPAARGSSDLAVDHRPAGDWPPLAGHPEIGARFLATFSELPPAVIDCVGQHHERQDGSGYPAGLTDAGLRPLAKLAGLADTLAALLTRGCFVPAYAQAMGEREETEAGASRDGTPAYEPRNEARLCARAVLALDFIVDEFPPDAIDIVRRALAPLMLADPPSVSAKYADLVMPVLQRIRAGRLAAESMVKSSASPALARLGAFALGRLQLIDKRLRAFELYEFSRWYLLEHDPQQMGAAFLLLDEALWRLHHLACIVQWRAESSGETSDSADEEMRLFVESLGLHLPTV